MHNRRGADHDPDQMRQSENHLEFSTLKNEFHISLIDITPRTQTPEKDHHHELRLSKSLPLLLLNQGVNIRKQALSHS